MKTIKLTRGKIARVCDCHYELVEQHTWHYRPQSHGKGGYAVTNIWRPELGKYRQKTMHRLILPNVPQVDHADFDQLNNQCSNLRSATDTENAQNRQKYSNNTSGYKGVQWVPHRKSWKAVIRVNGKLVHVKQSKNIKEVARAYNEAALQYFGKFARLNDV